MHPSDVSAFFFLQETDAYRHTAPDTRFFCIFSLFDFFQD